MDAVVEKYLAQHGVSEAATTFMRKTQRMHVNGQWIDSRATSYIDVIEPSTGGLLTRIPDATDADVDRAVAAARAQFDGGPWSRLKPLERERLLHKLADLLEVHAQELAEIESVDSGKSLAIARAADLPGTVDCFRYFAGWASKLHGRTVEPSVPGSYLAYTRKEPVGVVGVIVPWNFPILTLAWKLAAALATGCTVVVKPAEWTSLSTLRFAELAQKAGIPDGVINIVTGRGTGAGAALARHPHVNKISFTGSTDTGRSVGQSALDDMKRLTLELGGKSPVLVFPDVDLKKAAKNVAEGVFFNSGQVCDGGTRAYIHHSIYKAFHDELAAYTDTLKVAPGLDPDCFIGPLIASKQQARVQGYIASGRAEGAELVYGGKPWDGPGYFVAPTIFANCRNAMRIVQQEIFGPVLVTAPFDAEEEAIRLANDTKYGLAAAIYSNDLRIVHRLIPKLQAGSVYVNQHSTLDPAMPFGGYKQSGFGKDMGPEQLDCVMETKAVWITLS
jgi:phenylacetaldehyde dehydrogenase